MGKRKNALALDSLPQLPNVNEEIFERAGISLDDRAQLLKRVFDKTVKRLGATHVKVFYDKDTGIQYSKQLVDHTTQGKAIEQAIQLVDLKKQEAPKVTIKAEIRLPDYAQPNPKVIDITPKE